MNGNALKLLEETDKTRRVVQLAGILGGLLLLASGITHETSQGSTALDVPMIGLGVGFLILAASVKQRWSVEYNGHHIRFENSPVFAEKLFIDKQLVARGGMGYRMELSGVVKNGAGTGDRIVAVSEAGLFRFRCQIFAEPETRA